VRFEQYGGPEVLEVVEVERPSVEPGRVLVEVRAAGINPGEIAIREGRMHDRFPATFPSGEGSDLAGVVSEVGDGVEGFAVGDEVLGWSWERSSQAEYVAVPADQLAPKPAEVPWEVAGGLFVAGTTALACVRAVAPAAGEHVVVSGAAGGVGSLAVQLARREGAEVFGLAREANHAWLRDHGIIPIGYGDGVEQRLDEATSHRVDAFIDTFGGGYVDIAVSLGVAPARINTIIDFAAVERYGVKADGSATAATADALAELVQLIAHGGLDVPIAATYPLDRVRDAYAELSRRHTRGKIVLIP
jgi:NADPH:quinone reductase-like Zn-dependent oxidoreductase